MSIILSPNEIEQLQNQNLQKMRLDRLLKARKESARITTQIRLQKQHSLKKEIEDQIRIKFEEFTVKKNQKLQELFELRARLELLIGFAHGQAADLNTKSKDRLQELHVKLLKQFEQEKQRYMLALNSLPKSHPSKHELLRKIRALEDKRSKYLITKYRDEYYHKEYEIFTSHKTEVDGDATHRLGSIKVTREVDWYQRNVYEDAKAETERLQKLIASREHDIIVHETAAKERSGDAWGQLVEEKKRKEAEIEFAKIELEDRERRSVNAALYAKSYKSFQTLDRMFELGMGIHDHVVDQQVQGNAAKQGKLPARTPMKLAPNDSFEFVFDK